MYFWDGFPSKPRLYRDFSLIKRRRKKENRERSARGLWSEHCFRSVHHIICINECFIEADGSLTRLHLDGLLTTYLVFKCFTEQVWAFFQRWSLMVNLVVEDFSFAGKPFLRKQTCKMELAGLESLKEVEGIKVIVLQVSLFWSNPGLFGRCCMAKVVN